MPVTKRSVLVHPICWAVTMFAVIVSAIGVWVGFFSGSFRTFDIVFLVADRSGLVMDAGAKVKIRDIEVGRVAAIDRDGAQTRLTLELLPSQMPMIPANVDAQINATTIFGAKYVELIAPADPSSESLSAGAVLRSRNVTVEVNTVFENLVNVLSQVDVAKLNSVLSAVSEGVRGRGQQIGEAIVAANDVLLAINPRMPTVAQDWRSLGEASDAYAAAAEDIVRLLDAATTTSSTITAQAHDLDTLLLSTTGFSTAATNLLAPHKDNFVNAINLIAPTVALLDKYSPTYTCLLQGAQWVLDNKGPDYVGGNGRTLIADASLLFGDDPYRNPENLPIVGARGGPGGTPSCGSLPDVTKNFPVRALVTNTGWGTGLDLRPNPGIGHPFWVDYLPVTRGVPEPPSVRGDGPPAIGPVPYPGAPPYGAPLYGPGGVPLFPGVPPASASPSPPPETVPSVAPDASPPPP